MHSRTFGTSYGGSIHVSGTHLHASLPFYEQVDAGQARPAKLITGYRWFAHDRIEFHESIHFRFGCMQNDICSTVFWYQEGPVRPFFKLPRGRQLDYTRAVPELPRGSFDLRCRRRVSATGPAKPYVNTSKTRFEKPRIGLNATASARYRSGQG